jgi:hypothetical protein
VKTTSATKALINVGNIEALKLGRLLDGPENYVDTIAQARRLCNLMRMIKNSADNENRAVDGDSMVRVA